jgi:uncharacterized protein (UPF0335 family)
MTADEVEQLRRILDPAVRETVRDVLESEFRPFISRIETLEREVNCLKESRRSLFGIWTFVCVAVTFASKAIWDFLAAKFSHRP